VDPLKLYPSGRIDLLMASPECTHFSLARGGKPRSDQSRSSAWHIIRWASALYIDTILIENVREFTTWGPLGANGQPLKSQEGQTFHAFVNALKNLGYNVDWRVLNAADYGDPTTRERFFLMAKRGSKRRIVWPEATHARNAGAQADLFGAMQPWKPARDVIDWSIEGQSIFDRRKPLAPKTIARIASGLRQFAGKTAEPFLVILRNHAEGRSLDQPLPTLTASGQHIALCEPFVLGQQSGSGARPVSRPLPTVATGGAISLIEPFLIEYYGRGDARPVSLPLGTITTKDRFALVQPDRTQLNIRFRMLQPHELSAAMSFPAGYQFTGSRTEQVKQIGNAVPVGVASALCSQLIAAPSSHRMAA
jgi:DNA (cytosine-5)-methyltransferase 1